MPSGLRWPLQREVGSQVCRSIRQEALQPRGGIERVVTRQARHGPVGKHPSDAYLIIEHSYVGVARITGNAREGSMHALRRPFERLKIEPVTRPKKAGDAIDAVVSSR